MSMAGLRRLSNTQWLAEDAIHRGIPGDIIETGTWRGGMMAALGVFLRLTGVEDRTIWLADTFSGIPVFTDPKSDAMDRWGHTIALLKQNSPALVQGYMRRLRVAGPGVSGPKIEYLVGRFDETL
jgi:hypothetical protein